MVSSESHNIRPACHPLSTLGESGIQGSSRSSGVRRNPERIVVIMYNNFDIISEAYEDIVPTKLQFRRFQPPHSGLSTAV